MTAGSDAGGYDDWSAAQHAHDLAEGRASSCRDPDAQAVYDELYGLYRELHDTFGGVPHAQADLGTLMKRLLAIKERAAR